MRVEEARSVDEQLRELLANVLPRRELARTLDVQAGLRDAGLDSFRLMQLISDLQDTFHITLSDEDLVDRNFASLAAMQELITSKLAR